VSTQNQVVTALKEIMEGRGAFSRDQLEFAGNVIDEAKSLAKAAIPIAEARHE